MNKFYSYKEALEASKEYFAGEELSAKVFVDKYALKDGDGNFLEKTPDQMHDRLAKEFARIDANYGQDYNERFSIYRSAIDKFARIVPQGSPMAAIGNIYKNMSASNCVVVASPKDNVGSIIDSAKELAQLYKRRCGCGIDISTLRPEGTEVSNAARTTSGAWSFSDLYSYITRMIGQNSRRGALMVTLSVHHPDVIKFTTMKHDLTKVTGANVSLRLSDEFLTAVENNTDYQLRWPEENPTIISTISANDVWKIIIESAAKTAEPGLIFWDSMSDNLPANYYDDFKSISVNPCAEIQLSAYDSCRLISINLTGYVINAFEENATFDLNLFREDIDAAQRMADNLVDLELELINRIIAVCDTEDEKQLWQKLYNAGKNGRRCGVGTHGLADTLAQINVKYDSELALNWVDTIYSHLRDQAYKTSVKLAKERGPFPVFDYEKEKKCPFIERLPKDIKDAMKKHGRRNISLLTQAPTGSVSMLSKVGKFNTFNVSSGVEPVFRNSYTRRKKINQNDENVRIDFIDSMGDAWQEFIVHHSNVANFYNKIGNTKLPDYFVTSDQIDWNKRVELQGIEQQYIDHSISSTINLPKGTSSELVGKIYIEAWKKGLKGVTVYVDGCRDGVLIDDSIKNINVRPEYIMPSQSPKRPKELYAEICHSVVFGEKWVILIGLLNEDPYEMFMGKADKLNIPSKYKEGKLIRITSGNYNLTDMTNNILISNVIETANNTEGAWTTRMMSTALRHGAPIEYLVQQLSKEGSIVDINNVLARLLKKYIKNKDTKEACPQCGGHEIVHQDGCMKCISPECGFSKCN